MPADGLRHAVSAVLARVVINTWYCWLLVAVLYQLVDEREMSEAMKAITSTTAAPIYAHRHMHAREERGRRHQRLADRPKTTEDTYRGQAVLQVYPPRCHSRWLGCIPSMEQCLRKRKLL